MMIGSDKFFNLWQFAHKRANQLAMLSHQYDIFADLIGDLYSSDGIGDKGIDKVSTKVKSQVEELLEEAAELENNATLVLSMDNFVHNNYDDIRYYYRRIQEES